MGRQYHRMLPLVGVWRDGVTRLARPGMAVAVLPG